MDSLDTMFTMQKNLTSSMNLERYPNVVEERISVLTSAIIHEAVELQRLTNWKWWKKPTEFNLEAAREELIDIWHFVIQASIELGMNSADVLKEYQRKNTIHRDRQRLGY